MATKSGATLKLTKRQPRCRGRKSLVLAVEFDDDVPILQSALLNVEAARARVPRALVSAVNIVARSKFLEGRFECRMHIARKLSAQWIVMCTIQYPLAMT